MPEADGDDYGDCLEDDIAKQKELRERFGKGSQPSSRVVSNTTDDTPTRRIFLRAEEPKRGVLYKIKRRLAALMS